MVSSTVDITIQRIQRAHIKYPRDPLLFPDGPQILLKLVEFALKVHLPEHLCHLNLVFISQDYGLDTRARELIYLLHKFSRLCGLAQSYAPFFSLLHALGL